MAGRIPKPWYWEEKAAWYVNLRGKRLRLHENKDEAYRSFHRLMADQEQASNADAPASLTVNELAEQYLADLQRRTDGRTHYVARCYLKPFLADCGGLPIPTLKKHHVEASIRKHGRWNTTTENHVKSRIVALFNWGVEQGFIASNPVKGIKKPRAKSRGCCTLISQDEHETLLAAAPEYLRDVLHALHETGARPCEVLTVEARDFDADRGVWVLHKHKSEHATGKPRIVYLTPNLVILCKRLAAKHPTGPLFRRRTGRPFPPAYYLARLVRNLRRRLGLRDGITPYGLRHGFATDALANGIPDAQVAELMGHQGTAMLHRHYSHLTARGQVLRDALNRVRLTEQDREDTDRKA
jgi:integrase